MKKAQGTTKQHAWEASVGSWLGCAWKLDLFSLTTLIDLKRVAVTSNEVA